MDVIVGYWHGMVPGRSKKTVMAVGQAARLWGEFLPEVGPTEATRQHAISFRDHLLQERDPRTVSKLIALLATVFQTACDGGKLESNPFARIRVAQPKFPMKPRLPFEDSHIKHILDKSTELDTDMRWVTLIGLYTGMRIAEVCQLRRQDIKNQDGIICLDITADAGSLKNRGSARRVPVHPGLLDRGFMEFIDGKKDLLFEVDDSAASKRFGRFIRKIGIDDRKLVFHSFRHAFKEKCREAGIPEEIHDRLTGHSNGSVGRTYGGVPLKTLAEAVARLRFPV
jgi:integrase